MALLTKNKKYKNKCVMATLQQNSLVIGNYLT